MRGKNRASPTVHFLQPVQTRVGAQRHQLGIVQPLPWFGSRGRARAVENARAEAAAATIADTWLTLRRDLLVALHEVHRIDERRAIEVEALALLQQFESVTRARLRVDAATNVDVLRLQVEIGRADDRVRRLEDRRRAVVARVNALVNRPHATPLDATPSLGALAMADDGALAQHPRLAVETARAQAYARQAEVVRDRARPSFAVGLVHTFVDADETDGLSGDDATLATLSLRLPLWRSGVDGALHDAAAREASTHATRTALRNELNVALSEARFDVEDADRRIELYGATLLAKARESLRATLDAYAADRAGFADLIDAQRALLEFERALLDARVDRANAAAELARLLPTPTATDAVFVTWEIER